jgi:hypothetical protein
VRVRAAPHLVDDDAAASPTLIPGPMQRRQSATPPAQPITLVHARPTGTRAQPPPLAPAAQTHVRGMRVGPRVGPRFGPRVGPLLRGGESV